MAQLFSIKLNLVQPSTNAFHFENFYKYFLSTTKMTCGPWDPLPPKADAVDSTLRVSVKDLHSQIISYAPIKLIQPFMFFTRHFIFYLLIDSTRACIAWKKRDCACVLKQNKDKTKISSWCMSNIRTTAASIKCIRRGVDPHPTALQNYSPHVCHSLLTSVW